MPGGSPRIHLSTDWHRPIAAAIADLNETTLATLKPRDHNATGSSDR